VSTFLADVRYGCRVLARSPGFTCVAIAALAIGIGANLTIFGFAKELLLSPPAGIADPDRVVRAFTNRFSNTGYANYEAYRDRNHTFVALAAFRAESLSLRIEGAPEQIFGLAVSGNYFNALGVPAAIGRPILPADDRPDAPGAVLSDRFWRFRWASNPGVLGQTVTLNGRSATIVGVAPAAFSGTMAPLLPDVFVAVTQPRHGTEISSVQMIGRLRPGVAIGESQADLATLAASLVREAAPDRRGRPMLTVYAARTLVPEIAMPAAIFAGVLLVVVGLVLLLACVNIANLLLSRSAARTREIGIRAALGASRRRLLQQLLTESLLLSAVGGAGAAILAVAAARPIAAAAGALPAPAPIGLSFAVDWWLVAAALTLSLLTTVAFGLIPALQSSKHDVLPALKDGAATAGPRQSRLRAVFLTTQVAMSTLLLVLAALFVRGLVSAQTLDRGLVTDGVLAASIDLESAGYSPDRGALVYEQFRERLEQTPGITAATIVDIVPLTLSNRANEMVRDGQSEAADAPLVYRNRVTPGHFRTLGIPLVLGRDFDARDRAQGTAVAIVNETLARRFWPGENPLGKRFRERTDRESPASPWFEVVGVARDSKYVTVGEDPKPFMYRPMAQEYTPAGVVMVKTQGNAADALPLVRAAAAAIDPNLPLFSVMTLDAATNVSLLPVKIAAMVAGTLGALALILGAIGLYGVMSYLVRQRTREIGIRMALGAQRGAVIDLVTRNGMRWTSIGLVFGLAVSLAVAKVIAGFLYGVGPADPIAFIGIALLLIATAYVACYIPARRASRIDPLAALREE
jgi:putative ABC transport system permease protein